VSFELESAALSALAAKQINSANLLASPAVPVIQAPRRSYDLVALPGDFPDPTIARINGTYWASATSAEWGGVFPLFRSDDLVNWEPAGSVFPQGLPAWASSNAWAPEIFEENGRTYIYYTARRQGGVLSVAVASADRPEGPYTDHGPLVGQRAGSIDGCPVHDEQGRLWLVWKEDGNSCFRPTPIWAQRLNAERTGLVGKKVELFRNDAAWEGSLVEGSAFIRHGEYLYMFYAGNACCGKHCTYATGVARAKTLLGPWEKCPLNPILTDNKTWKCAGHGTPIEADGRYLLFHHAYSVMSQEFVGRQGILSEFTWGPDGWPHFAGRSVQAPAPDVRALHVEDSFDGPTLADGWQWPTIAPRPATQLCDGQLLLPAGPARLGNMVVRRTTAATYRAAATLDPSTLEPGTFGGIAAVGDPYNGLALVAGAEGVLEAWRVQAGQMQRLAHIEIEPCAALTLRLECWGGQRFRFAYSTDGATWQQLETEGFTVNGTWLPPWDRGVRVALLAQGTSPTHVAFSHFAIVNQR
jgi:xylan 1,4-beta-xylosidase